jgi:hypothetical protein
VGEDKSKPGGGQGGEPSQPTPPIPQVVDKEGIQPDQQHLMFSGFRIVPRRSVRG